MKNIISLYEDGVVATPANTMGMGNPMPATDTTPGSEPICTKPTPKAKCKKEKCKKCTNEGILSDIDTTLQTTDDVIEFAKWFVNQHLNNTSLTDEDAALTAMINATSFTSKDTVVIDVAKAIEPMVKRFCPDALYITIGKMPKNIKNIKIINCKYGFAINSFVGDLSNLNVEVYTDAGRTFGDLDTAFKMSTAGAIYKFGNIKCDKFKLASPKVKMLEFGEQNDMISVDLEQCTSLEHIKGDFGLCTDLRISKHFIKCQLVKSGLINDDTTLRIYN